MNWSGKNMAVKVFKYMRGGLIGVDSFFGFLKRKSTKKKVKSHRGTID